MESKKKKKKVDGRRVVNIIASLVVIGCLVQLTLIGLQYYRARKEYSNIAKKVVTVNKDKEISTKIDYEKLKSINSDYIAWIRFENNSINYPIVQGQDNDYYLNHTIEKTYLPAGSIFMDCDNNSDFTDGNTFIYGHNMKEKSMFGILNNFRKKEYYEKNKSFYIYTKDYTYRYDIFSVYLAEIESQEDSFIIGMNRPEELKQYIDTVKERSTYKIDVHPDGTKPVVTLMTCNDAGHDYRYLVHGVLAETVPAK